jgi:5-methylcytosine-specific restriction protein A
MQNLQNYLKSRLPEEWIITTDQGVIQVRDKAIDRGKGYNVSIHNSAKSIEAIIKFEDFAGELVKHANKQFTSPASPLIRIFNSSKVKCQRYSVIVEDAFTGENKTLEKWWVNLSLQKDNSEIYPEESFADILLSFLLTVIPYDVEDVEEEGAAQDQFSTVYERSRKNRAICLAYYGYNCNACGIKLRERYGIIAKNFIHVHHINPVSVSGQVKPDPIKDLIPLCPTCHAIAHLTNPPISVEEIRNMIINNYGKIYS